MHIEGEVPFGDQVYSVLVAVFGLAKHQGHQRRSVLSVLSFIR
jgi:hypothetical protein